MSSIAAKDGYSAMRNVCAGLFVILAIATRAGASTIVISDITGGWQNADPGANAFIFNDVDQAVDVVRWGGGNSPTAGSGYFFDPNDNPVSSPLGSPFALGLFTHVNEPIPSGSSITSIEYSFALATNGVPNSLSNTFNFSHDETPNSTPCPTPSPTGPCDDIVTVSPFTFNSFIQVGTDEYYFNLLGFSTDGGITIRTQFLSAEGGTNSATLYGILTSQPLEVPGGVVPEPASLVLMGTGMALLARRLRKRSR